MEVAKMKKKVHTKQEQSDYASAQIICKPPNGGNNSPAMKNFALKGGFKNGS
jgi:hypothetical protein